MRTSAGYLFMDKEKYTKVATTTQQRIEIAVRAVISNTMSLIHGPWWYLHPELFKTSWSNNDSNRFKTPEQVFLAEVNSLCLRRKQEDNIEKYYNKYHSPQHPPSWMIIENLSFGKCTSLYRYIRSPKDKAKISSHFQFHPKILETALEAFRYTRNLCAHHARFWDRWFVYKPRALQELKAINCRPGTLKEQLALILIYHRKIAPESEWHQHLFHLFEEYNRVINFESMGFISDWSSDLFWKA